MAGALRIMRLFPRWQDFLQASGSGRESGLVAERFPVLVEGGRNEPQNRETVAIQASTVGNLTGRDAWSIARTGSPHERLR